MEWTEDMECRERICLLDDAEKSIKKEKERRVRTVLDQMQTNRDDYAVGASCGEVQVQVHVTRLLVYSGGRDEWPNIKLPRCCWLPLYFPSYSSFPRLSQIYLS